ncbi:MAG: GNAT family N-acetyltransferase [Williamsia sp.]|nr:GNAT family N-acetyltransferase [Williamsia sp.]
MNVRLVSYDPKYDASLRALELAIVQGRSIKLEILKDHFLSRTTVYKTYHTCLAVDENEKAIGTAIGAKTEMIVNGDRFPSGVCYDVKVHPLYRKKGVGKLMAKHFYQTFFKEHGLTRNFITLKLSNHPVIRLVSAVHKIWLYEFVYLTLPTKARVPQQRQANEHPFLFSITLFQEETVDPSYYTVLPNGLGYFYTYKMYRLAITHIHPVLKWGLRIGQLLQPARYAHAPQEGDTLRFACLYNHDAQNIKGINDVLEELEHQAINYLLVGCRKGDVIYRALEKQSINTYGYYVLADFPLNKKDKVTIDVRCL